MPSTNQAPTTGPCSAGTESASPLPSPAMTRQTGLEPNPRSYLTDGAQWPSGPLRATSPPEALLACAIFKRLHEALAGRSTRQIAELAGLSHQTVINVLNGATWWDAITIAPRTSPRRRPLGRRTPQTPNPHEAVTRQVTR